MRMTDHFNLRSFDLNLLVAFDALMLDKSVTKAAARLRVGQPAMSHQLAALRLLFDDELFVRIGNIMQPTAKAKQIALLVADVLASAEQAILSSDRFNPIESTRTFHLGFSCEELLILPDLGARFRSSAPHIKIMARRVAGSEIGRQLDELGVEIGVGCYRPAPARYLHEVLFEQELCCCFSERLTGIDGAISLDAYLGAQHVLVSQDDDVQGCIGSILASAGYQLNVAMAVPEYLTTLAAAAQSPLIATLPGQIAYRYGAKFGLCVQSIPMNVSLDPVCMIWSERSEADAAARWLREEIRALSMRRRIGLLDLAA